MPDLNLQEEEGSFEVTEEKGSEESDSKAGGRDVGGALVKVVIIILALVIVGGGGAFLLNSLGIVKLWGTKPAPQVVELEEQTPPATAPETGTAEEPQMIETPPLAGAKTPAQPKTTAPAHAAMPAAPAPKLGDMKGEFTIQVSAWRDRATAELMVKRLEEAGYPAFVEERSYKDGTWYTVRVGRYASRKEAQMAVETFAEELRSQHWIDRVRSK